MPTPSKSTKRTQKARGNGKPEPKHLKAVQSEIDKTAADGTPIAELSKNLKSTQVALRAAQQAKFEKCKTEVDATLAKYGAMIVGVPRLVPSPAGFVVDCGVTIVAKPAQSDQD